jgi:subtilisin
MMTMRKIRRLIIFSALLFLPFSASAAPPPVKEYIIGFHHLSSAGETARVLKKQNRLKKSMKRLPVLSAILEESEAQALRQDPRVAYVAENLWLQAIDPRYSEEYASSWGVTHIGSRLAHEAGYLGKDVHIAILDTGIDYTHRELVSRYNGGDNLVYPDTSDPMDDNSSSHGTHVAGVIAAALNAEGVVGVAPQAYLYGVKVLDGSGSGSIGLILEGIDWAMDNDMDIVHMSLGFPGEGIGEEERLAICNACDNAYAAGLLLVASAGNANGGAAYYPAACTSVIAVNATREDESFAAFSARDARIELAAPGLSILSTARGDQYAVLSGTSQAAPHVTGVAALLFAAEPARTNEEIRLLLQQTAIDLGPVGRDAEFGFGRVDAASALGLHAPPDETNLKRRAKRNKKPKLTELKKFSERLPE